MSESLSQQPAYLRRMSKNISSLSGRDGKELDDPLWERLQKAASADGTPEDRALTQIADDFLIGEAITYGTSSFYDFLKKENQGKKAYVCNGSACLVAGTQDKVHHELAKRFKPEEIGHMCCLGRCHENSAFNLGGLNYSGDAIDRLAEVVDAGLGVERLKVGGASSFPNMDAYHVGTSMAAPILTAPMPPLPEFYAVWEQVLKSEAVDVLNEIKTATIRGRGGAGFPMGFKLEACRNAQDTTGTGTPRKYIVCNADEGDPAAYSDRYLLEQRPHRVLLGMMIAGYCVGADTGVLYIRAEYPEAVEIVKQAMRDLEANGWIGNDIKGSGFHWRFKVIKAAGAYVCGEESALIESIEGRRGMPRQRPPYVAERGLFGRPTLVNNVETLFWVPEIARRGAAWFAGQGRRGAKGVRHFSVSGRVKNPGVKLAPAGITLRELVDEFCGGMAAGHALKGYLPGGASGGILPASLADLPLDFGTLRDHGCFVGSHAVVVLSDKDDMKAVALNLMKFFEHESCGQCTPCRVGTEKSVALLARESWDASLLDELGKTMTDASICGLGQAAANPVFSVLRFFPDDAKR